MQINLSRILRVAAALALMAAVAFVMALTLFFPLPYADEIARLARENGLDASLIASVAVTESGFDANATSRRGAVGIMQLLPSTAEQCAKEMRLAHTKEMLTDPHHSLALGAHYLAYLMRRFGSERAALAAYNAGEGNVSGWLNADGSINIPFPETAEYVNRVLIAKRIYEIKFAARGLTR